MMDRTTSKKSPLAWLGGKSKLADRIIQRMPDHEAYCEVFAGAAWVLFKKPESRVEIINDINSELVNLYRCVRLHLEELCKQFKWMRAARFYYLAKTSFGAKVRSPTFGIAATGPSRLNLLRIEEDLSQAHLRLSRVTIENRPYDQVIRRFDKPGTLFYIDPPYWGCEDDYGVGIFNRGDFDRLAGQLDGLAGKFILSLNDTPGVREVFQNFHIEAIDTKYSIGSKRSGAIGEVLITNFKPVLKAG